MKEKADELVEMFKQYAKDSLNESSEFTPTGNAIKCAIICVDEILLDKPLAVDEETVTDRLYWQSVLNELKSRL